MITTTLAISCLFAPAPQWTPLFNGQNLDGWKIVNGATSTWTVSDHMIICSGKPTGVIRTDKTYENFILDFDWKHLQTNGNAGLFVWSAPFPAIGVPFTRSIEVQIMVGKEGDWYTTQGDIFSIWGAKMTPDDPHPMGDHIQRCLPSERRTNPAPQWNHYTVTCIDGQINLSVNGAFVTGGYDITPRMGYICLESEGTEAHFKNINIMELPPSSPKVDDVHLKNFANYTTLFTGIDLSGWVTDDTTSEDWSVGDNVMTTNGNGKAITTTHGFKDFEFVVDYRCKDENAKPFIIINGEKKMLSTENSGSFNRENMVRGAGVSNNGQISLGSDAGVVDFCNIFVHEAKTAK